MDTRQSGWRGWHWAMLGALGVLVVEGALWGGWHIWCAGGRGSSSPAPIAVEAPPGNVPASPVADAGGTASKQPQPDAAPTTSGTMTADVADPASEPPAAASNVPPEPLTPEELLTRKAEESVQRRADEASRAAEQDEAERTFWADRFDAYKAMIMATIDGYFECPAEGRYDYLVEKNREFMTQLFADRKAAKLPAEIRNPQKVNEEFMKMLGERMNAEERQKLDAYIQDMVKVQLDRMKTLMDAPGGPPPSAPPTGQP